MDSASASATNFPRRPVLVYSRANFDDYWTALMAACRQHDAADQVYTGALPHPLIDFQQLRADDLEELHVITLPPEQLLTDPLGMFRSFIDLVIEANAALDEPNDPPLAGWADLLAAWALYRTGQRKLFSSAVATLRVGESMHYARGIQTALTCPGPMLQLGRRRGQWSTLERSSGT